MTKRFTLFLDANILFSAAYQDKSDILNLWKIKYIHLITSHYALEEAKRNLGKPEQLKRLENLILGLKVVHEMDDKLLPTEIQLRSKDRPILAAAIAARADYLITGDFKDFGEYFGKSILGVKILPPALFFREELLLIEKSI
jgi:predicted nucleic acid-binding protein